MHLREARVDTTTQVILKTSLPKLIIWGGRVASCRKQFTVFNSLMTVPRPPYIEGACY